MEIERKRIILILIVALMAFVALVHHRNERKRLRALEEQAVVKPVPNASIAMPNRPQQQ